MPGIVLGPSAMPMNKVTGISIPILMKLPFRQGEGRGSNRHESITLDSVLQGGWHPQREPRRVKGGARHLAPGG